MQAEPGAFWLGRHPGAHLLLHERLVGRQQAAQGGGVQAAQRFVVLLLRWRQCRERRGGRRGAHLQTLHSSFTQDACSASVSRLRVRGLSR